PAQRWQAVQGTRSGRRVMRWILGILCFVMAGSAAAQTSVDLTAGPLKLDLIKDSGSDTPSGYAGYLPGDDYDPGNNQPYGWTSGTTRVGYEEDGIPPEVLTYLFKQGANYDPGEDPWYDLRYDLTFDGHQLVSEGFFVVKVSSPMGPGDRVRV